MNVLHVVNQLGYGGTEKNIFNICKYAGESKNFIAVLKEKGNAFENFTKYAKVYFQPDLIKLCDEENIEIIHIHRAGFKEDEFLKPFENLNIPIIETNIFANFDSSELSQKLIKLHLLISYDSINTLSKNANGNIPSWYNFDILYLATDDELLDVYPLFDNNNVGRISREDDLKWHKICIDALSFLKDKMDFRFNVIGLTNYYRTMIQIQNFYNKVQEMPQMYSIELLKEYMQSLSVYIHGSQIGETFGLSIAEAMMSGLPIVTLSTPETDNAQTELVSDKVTGFVCKNLDEYCFSLLYVLRNKKLANIMGNRGRERARHLFAASKITRKLENVYKQIKMEYK
jgi:glycosyltransferase involved in cell wall biosynthesis